MTKNNSRKLTRRQLKQKAVDFLGGKCEACGYNSCLAALTFHHRNPNEKDFSISDLIGLLGWSKIKRELLKCSLVCSNCHYEIHEGILDGYLVYD